VIEGAGAKTSEDLEVAGAASDRGAEMSQSSHGAGKSRSKNGSGSGSRSVSGSQ